MKDIIRYGVILALICLVAAGLLSGMNLITKDRILAQAQTEELGGLKEVMPEAASFEPVKEKDEVIYYIGKDADKKTTGFVFKTSAKGYSSVIETMAGITPDGTITGIKVLNQNETPGLGARICEVKADKTIGEVLKGGKPAGPQKPWFQLQFTGKKIGNFDEVQAITGATISSRAVIESVKKRAEEILKLVQK